MSADDVSSPARPQTRQFTYTDTDRQRGVTITIDDSRDDLLTDFGKQTLTDRYLIPGESYQDLFARVACANSDEIVWGDADSGHAQLVYDAISQLWFMPATPVLTNSGLDRGLPISCFLNKVYDSMESIAETVNENIWLASKGGGIGTSWAPVRSIGEPIAGSMTGTTSGIIPFIHWMNAQTLAISQGSLRRGSAAAYIDCRHPELEEFLTIRKPASGGDQRRKAEDLHHGLLVSDEFLDAAFSDNEEDRQWDLLSPKTGEVRKTVDARKILVKILQMRLETGEPYIIFEGNVEREIPETYKALGLKPTQSNLCSEIVLHTGLDHRGKERTAVCCLSSLNVEKWDEWKGNVEFLEAVQRFLDNVLEIFIEKTKDMPGFERARYAAMAERSVGLGMMGFHSLLQRNEIPYESKAAQELNLDIWTYLAKVSADIDRKLAEERGPCIDWIDAHRAVGDEAGPKTRNTHRFSIAPTASISIICGGASPAGELWPANVFTQKTLSGSFTVRNKYLDAQLRRRYHQLRDTLANSKVSTILQDTPAFRDVITHEEDEWVEAQWQNITINDGSVQHLPYLCPLEKATYRTAFECDQRWVIRHHADRAPYVCQAQSVNLFMPANAHTKDIVAVHKMAWEEGLKSLYYLRSRTVSKAMSVGHAAGEMPSANLEQPQRQATPMYEEEMVCESCQ